MPTGLSKWKDFFIQVIDLNKFVHGDKIGGRKLSGQKARER